jgi:hypothetical protein
MKTKQRKQRVEVECENEVKSFGMVVDAKSFGVIVDGIYSNTIDAIIREYCCNAIDSHKDAGHMRPFTINLPSRENPTFWVRDYGVGLNEDDIVTVFTVAFKSTKENSNLVTGQLGIGAMCAFAYNTKSFTVTSWKDGQKYVYSCFINDDGCPAYVKILQEDSNEETGVRIDIACLIDDVGSFYSAAQSIVSRFDIRPTINCEITYLENEESLMSGDGWAIYNSDKISDGCSILMGNVLYSVPKSDKLKRYAHLTDSNIILRAEIGDIDFSTSREHVKLTTRTIQWIESRLSKINKELVENLNKKIENSRSVFDALRNVSLEFNNVRGTGLYQLFRTSLDQATFQGAKLSEESGKISNAIRDFKFRRFNYKGGTSKGYKEERQYGIAYLYCDIDIYREDKKGCIAAIGRKVKETKRSAIIVPDTLSLDEICFLFNCSKDEIIEASSLPKPVAFRYNGSRGSVGKISKWVYTEYATKAWRNCEVDLSDTSPHYYIPRHQYNVFQDGKCIRPACILPYVNILIAEGINTIYGVQAKHMSKLPPNWINAIDYANSIIKERHLSSVIEYRIFSVIQDSVTRTISRNRYSYDFIKANKNLLDGHELKGWIDFVESYHNKKMNMPINYRDVHDIIRDDIAQEVDKRVNEALGTSLSIIDKYPIIHVVLRHNNREANIFGTSQILNFIGVQNVS